MNKIILALALSFSSCEMVEINPEVKLADTHEVSFTAVQAETKTVLDGLNVKWVDTDKANIRVYEVYNDTLTAKSNGADSVVVRKQASSSCAVTFNAEKTVATINAKFDKLSGRKRIVGYSSIVAKEVNSAKNPSVLTIQTPTDSSFDPDADILVSDVIDVSGNPTLTDLKFTYTRPVSVNKMTLTGFEDGERIKSVVLSTPSKYFASTYVLDTKKNTSNASSITCNYSNKAVSAEATLDVYFVSGTGSFTPTVTVTTDRNVYSRTFRRAITFAANEYHTYTVNLFGTSTPITVVPYKRIESTGEIIDGGKYIIAATDASYVMGGYTNGNNHPAVLLTKTDDSNISLVTPSLATPVIIEESGEAGYYTIKNCSGDDYNGQYLVQPSDNNYLKESETLNDYAKWSITIESGVATIKSKRNNQYVVRYNDSNKIFATYKGTQNPVSLFVASRPTIDCADMLSISKDETASTFSVKWLFIDKEMTDVNLFDNESCTIPFNESWLSVSMDSNKNIRYSASENTAESPRTAYMRLYALDNDANEIVKVIPVTQASAKTIAGWLELPAPYSKSAIQTSTTSSLGDLISLTHYVNKERNYTFLYDPEMYASYWVAYPLAKGHMTTGRKDSFGYDPDVPQSKQTDIRSGYGLGNVYARGHQLPNADRNNIAEMQTQTYYATNMTPQLQNGFNGGIWASLESGVRSAVPASDTVYVVTGAAFRKVGGSETITYVTNSNDGKSLPLPNYYWKVLLKVKRDGASITNACAVGFWLPHQAISGTNYANYAVSVDQIEEWTGFDFFANLPVTLATPAEKNTNWSTFKTF